MDETKTILAIDDNPDILYTLEQICTFRGWRILTALNWATAKPQLTAEPIDVILVDYHMPGADGVDAVRGIRRVLPDVPIIVLTCEERGSVMQRFLDAGANDYALKPIKALDLISRIQVHLQYHARSRYYTNHEKGISASTMQTVLDFLDAQTDFLDAEEIAEQTGIKKKTLYRYLNNLQQHGRLHVQQAYGDTGRPRTLYRLKG